MNRTVTGIVASLCLLASSSSFADQRFNACLKSYSGEASKYATCFNKLGNRALDKRNKAFNAAASNAQSQFDKRQQALEQQQAKTQGQGQAQAQPTYKQPTYQRTQPFQQRTTQPTTRSTTRKVAEEPTPEESPSRDKGKSRRIQFY